MFPLFRIFLLGVSLTALTGVCTAAETPPNVLLLLGDDQAWGDFGFMGHPEIRTPHLDALAAQGAVFSRSYVPSSLCRPSLATLITGRYPHQHKISGNDPPKGTPREAMLQHIQREPTIPKLLAKRGYVSLQTGKWWEGAPALGGFTEAMTHGDPARGGRHGDVGLRIGRETLQPVYDFIDGHKNQPFFVWYAPMMPHTPHNPPERLLAKYRGADKPITVARYHAMCEWFDETIGELLAYLDRKQLSDNTLVVFVTDNGWIQDTQKQVYAPRSKRSPYEGGIRSPIILRWPGRIPPGKYDTLASSIDLAPTILAAAGAEVPAELPGLNLLPIIQAGEKSPRNQLFGEIFDHDVAEIDRPAASLLYRWTIQDQWKLILPTAAGARPELYDLSADPTEDHDLAAAQPERVRKLTADIDQWWNARE